MRSMRMTALLGLLVVGLGAGPAWAAMDVEIRATQNNLAITIPPTPSESTSNNWDQWKPPASGEYRLGVQVYRRDAQGQNLENAFVEVAPYHVIAGSPCN